MVSLSNCAGSDLIVVFGPPVPVLCLRPVNDLLRRVLRIEVKCCDRTNVKPESLHRLNGQGQPAVDFIRSEVLLTLCPLPDARANLPTQIPCRGSRLVPCLSVPYHSGQGCPDSRHGSTERGDRHRRQRPRQFRVVIGVEHHGTIIAHRATKKHPCSQSDKNRGRSIEWTPPSIWSDRRSKRGAVYQLPQEAYRGTISRPSSRALSGQCWTAATRRR